VLLAADITQPDALLDALGLPRETKRV